MSRVAPNSPADKQPEFPTQGVRTLISFLLFVHLFLLGGAILGNLSVRSPLMSKLVATPGIRSYLSILNLNTAFQFALTDERDHEVFIALNVPKDAKPLPSADSDAGPLMTPPQLAKYDQVKLTPNRVTPGIRQRRFLKLGQILAQSNDESMSFLAVALANGLLRENNMEPTTGQNGPDKSEHHLVCHEFLNVPLIPNGPDAADLRSTAFDKTVYPAGAEWGVTKPENKGEVSGGAGGAARRPRSRPLNDSKPAPVNDNGANRNNQSGNDKTQPSSGSPATLPASQGS